MGRAGKRITQVSVASGEFAGRVTTQGRIDMDNRWRKSAGLAAGMLSGVLIASGCGDSDKKGGELVEQTEEVEASRAAMQNQLKENPNLYAPPKKATR
jgi:hypothetical protein